jgi:ribosomal protein S18 acetylase RimI-like enzyme
MLQVRTLLSLGAAQGKNTVWSQVEDIFFESSVRKTFASEEERRAFKFKYLDWYAEHHPECFFVAIGNEKKVQGYICGTPQTSEINPLNVWHPWYTLFSDLLSHFPAHLHINCSADARGMGLGATLLSVFENYLRGLNCRGVHLITAPDARNVGFYDRNGYKFQQLAPWMTGELLFMGKSLLSGKSETPA